ncbi:MAG: hypothetical protein JRF71_05345 [Deltaproteobacteria bacterium]|nr:hypothetical protein [Deltaproteobacteria bacterium]
MVYPPGDIKNDLVASRKKLGDEAVIVGNYDVFHLPCREETTVEEARAGIRTNINGPVDAVWPGCDLWPDIKPEDWFAMEEEARTYKVGPTPVTRWPRALRWLEDCESMKRRRSSSGFFGATLLRKYTALGESLF